MASKAAMEHIGKFMVGLEFVYGILRACMASFVFWALATSKCFFLEPNDTSCPSCMSFGCKCGQAESSSSGGLRNELLLICRIFSLVSYESSKRDMLSNVRYASNRTTNASLKLQM